MSTTKTRLIDFNVLSALAARNASTISSLQAGAEETREVTGEEILALVTAAGGTVANVEKDENGVITSLQASGSQMTFEDLDDLALFTGCEPGELVEALIDEINASSEAAKKITGDLAQTSVGSPIAITGSTTSASAIITSPSSTVGLSVGMSVAGAGVPAGTTLISLSPLTMSANATATASGVALTINAEVQVIGLAEWTIDWKRKTADATTTDDSAYESSVGSSASWSVKAKYIFLVGDTTQANAILAAISSPQAAQQWNFFPDVSVGHPAFTGSAYIDGITIAAGTGKIVGLDVSLKGTGPLTSTVQVAPVANTATITDSQAEV